MSAARDRAPGRRTGLESTRARRVRTPPDAAGRRWTPLDATGRLSDWRIHADDDKLVQNLKQRHHHAVDGARNRERRQ